MRIAVALPAKILPCQCQCFRHPPSVPSLWFAREAAISTFITKQVTKSPSHQVSIADLPNKDALAAEETTRAPLITMMV